MKDDKAAAFAQALTELCHSHGVMLWTAVKTQPIMASDASAEDHFHYVVEKPEFGNSVILRRVLE